MMNRRKYNPQLHHKSYTTYQKSLLTTDDKMSDSALLQSIQEHLDNYELEECIEQANLGVSLYPLDARMHEYLALGLFKNKQMSLALKVIDQALELNPFSRQLIVLKVRVSCNLGLSYEVQNWINELSERLERSEWGALYLAQAYLCKYRDEKDNILFYASQAIKYCPDSEEAYTLFSQAIENSREYTEAISFFMECIDDDPYSYLAWYHLALAQLGSGQYYEAIQSYEYAFIANPDFHKAYLDCAELSAELGFWRKALITCIDLEKRTSLDGDAYALMIKCYLSLNMPKDAGKYLKKLKAYDSSHEELYFLIGDKYYCQRKWHKASHAYSIALEGNDQEDEYIFRWARSLSKIGQTQKAISLFEEAIELGPEQNEYWFVFAKYLIKIGKLNYAEYVLQQAEESTFSPRLDYLRSILLLKNNQRHEGLNTLSEALKEDKDHIKLIYKYLPEAKNDKQIQSMIQYFS